MEFLPPSSILVVVDVGSVYTVETCTCGYIVEIVQSIQETKRINLLVEFDPA